MIINIQQNGAALRRHTFLDCLQCKVRTVDMQKNNENGMEGIYSRASRVASGANGNVP